MARFTWICGWLGRAVAFCILAAARAQAAEPPCIATPAPQPDLSYAKLSDTGLYCDSASAVLSEDVQFFEPENALWSDGAQKQRFIRLPDGEQIDSANMDGWIFPIGTQVWKEFVFDGKKVETRLLEKRADGTWYRMAYAWNDDQTDAFPVPDGVVDAAGTAHNIPSTSQCTQCHRNSSDMLLGVQAMQLARANPAGMTIDSLLLANKLSTAPTTSMTYPGGPVDARALGYLYANCSNCHRGPTAPAGLNLFTSVYDTDVQSTQPYLTAVNQLLSRWVNKGYQYRIVAGDPEHSGVIARMSSRNPADQMPRIGTELIHPEGIAIVSEWIRSLLPGTANDDSGAGH